MWNQMWIPVLIPTLIIKSNCDNNRTEDDVFIRYGGHAEADYLQHQPTTTTIKILQTTTTITDTTTSATTTPAPVVEEVTEAVMFIPNSRQVVRRDEEEYDGENMRIKDILMMKSLHDAVDKNFHMQKETESPNEDIVFISGKNHDYEKPKAEESRRRNTDTSYQSEKEEEKPKIKLNCKDLDCNNTIKSVCGGKLENREWKFRHFMNECYFRKVNCGLKYEINRYKEVSMDKCKQTGAYMIERTFSFTPKHLPSRKAENTDKYNVARRSSSSRRSMTTNYNGEFCSHPCPASCPEEYDPQCAISATGRRRVFMNHCKLDYNSCFYSVVWHKRPLAECVGGKKADMRQNRGFIGWMQRVGIVDKRGRLVLE